MSAAGKPNMQRPKNPQGVDYTKLKDWRLLEDDHLDTDMLKLWMQEMVRWGQRVRDDILRFEAAAGLAKGDPGDPPPEPE